ncbi:MAG: hypothetical protein SH817_00140 [Leptospira sp.]|nr:hypothetical protein [Leptospira sp.]
MTEIFHLGPNDDLSSDMMRDASHYLPEVSLRIKAIAIQTCEIII